MPLFATCLLLAVTTLLASDPKATMKAKNKLQDAVKAASNNNFEKMYDLAREAESLDATLAEPYAYSGLYLYRTGDSASAEKDFQKALTLDPNLSMPRVYLGNILFERGDSDRALDEWFAGLRLDSKSPEALASYAVGLFVLGKTTEAIQQYKKALMYDRRYYEKEFLSDRKKGAAWGQKKGDAVAPLLEKVEKPKFPY
jgi:tetratricopeptide (TPR) repeat protein